MWKTGCQFSNTKEKNSYKKGTLFKNTGREPRLLKLHKIPIYGKNKMYSTPKTQEPFLIKS